MGFAELKQSISQVEERLGSLEESNQKTLEAAGLAAELSDIKQVATDVKNTLDRFEGDADWAAHAENLKTRVDELEVALKRAPAAMEEAKTVGAEIMAQESFKTYQQGGEIVIPSGYGRKIAMPSLTNPAGMKTLDTTSVQIRPVDYRPGVVSQSLETMTLAMRLIRQSVPGALNWVVRKETLESLLGYVTSLLAADVVGQAVPVNVCQLESVVGYVAGTKARFQDASGYLIKDVEIASVQAAPTNTLTFAAGALDFDADQGWRVSGMNYGAIPEGNEKSEGDARIVQSTQALKTLPTTLPVTEQLLSSDASITSWVENKLRMRSIRNLSWHLLYGDGSQDNQLHGWDNATNAPTYTWSSGETGDNRFDAIFRGAGQIPWTGAMATVMNKQDLISMLLAKGNDDHYTIGSEMFQNMKLIASGGQMFAGPFEIIMDDAVKPLDFFVANLTEASELIDAEIASMRWGWVMNQFKENERTALYEERLLHAINVEEALVLGEFDAPPA
jgi:hypothetical protein